MSEHDIDSLIESLESEDADKVSQTLRSIQYQPTGSSRVLEAIQRLFSDTRICFVYVEGHIEPKFYYGEVAWLAGQTLSFEYAHLGIEDNVEVPNTFEALSIVELNKLADSNDFQEAQGVMDEWRKDLIRVLDKRRKLNRQTIVFWTKHAWYELKNHRRKDGTDKNRNKS